MSTRLHEGKIIEFTDRNSGYIKEKDGDARLFFDSSDLVGISFTDLKLGDKLFFAITKSLKGPYATRVSKTKLGQG